MKIPNNVYDVLKCSISVKNFQSDNGLTVDGIVGKNTAEKLGFKWEG